MRRAITAVGVMLAGLGVAAAAYRPPPADVGVLVIDTAGGARQRVTTESGAVTWSRDGRRLFISGGVRIANPPWQPFETRDLSGRRIDRRKLVTADVAEGDVALSPDRRRIAYEAAPRDRSLVNTGDLVVAPVGGGRATRLLTRTRGTPAWSPDGTRLAVERWSFAGARGDGDDAARIVVVSARGGGVRTLVRGREPGWLPDGRLLVRQGTRLITVDRAGADRRVLVGHLWVTSAWDVARDGRLAVTGGGVRVAAGGAEHKVTSEPVTDIAWSPDGASLAAVEGGRVRLLDPAGAAPPREITRIRGRALSGLAWSPDGRHLALSAEIPHHGD